MDSEARSEVMARVWSINFIFKQDGQEEEKHCWKVKCLRRVNEARSSFDYEIGVTCVEYVDELPFADAVTNSCSWRCQGKKDSGYQRMRKKGGARYLTF